MKFGFISVATEQVSDPAIADVAQLAERLGFESFWCAEHMAIPKLAPGQTGRTHDTGILDPLICLTYVAARTSTIRLGTGVLILPQHHPVKLAKQVATLDVLSGGRVMVGVGLGHVEPELRALGVSLAERGARADEYLRVMIALWTSELASYEGRFVSFSDIGAYPRPVQRPHPPIVMGGRVPRSYRRAAEFAAGWYGYAMTPEVARQHITGLEEACRRFDRPRLEITIHPRDPLTPALVGAYEDAGVDRLLLRLPNEQGAPAVRAFVEDNARALL